MLNLLCTNFKTLSFPFQRRTLSILCLVCSLFFSLLFSFSALAQTPEKLPAALEHLSSQGITPVQHFPISKHLNGWVINYGNQNLIVYVSADGQHLLNGVLLDAKGADLTQSHQQEWLPSPSWEDLVQSNFIREPSLNKPSDTSDTTENTENPNSGFVYVFFDTNCPFCRLAWEALQDYRQAGLEVRWIPVAYLQPSSRQEALNLLQQEDAAKQQQLLQESMQQQVKNASPESSSSKNTPEDAASTNASLAKLEANMQLMQKFRLQGTPGWVWQDADGKIHSRTGMVKLGELPDITGLPEQKHSSRELMRFR